jgi:hypothetical protein
MFSSAGDISIALVIAGDRKHLRSKTPSIENTFDRKHLSLAVAPIVLTTSRTYSGGASRINGDRQNTVFPTPDIRSVAHPPISPRGGGDADVLASPPFNLFKPASRG